METLDFAEAPPWGLQGEKGAPRHGSPCASLWTSSGPSKATSGRSCCRGNILTAALSIPLLASCCRAVGQERGWRTLVAKRRWGRCSGTWKTRSPGAPSGELLAASQEPHTGARRHRFSQGQAAGAHQGRAVPCSRLTPSPRRATGTCPRACRGLSEQTAQPAPALAQARAEVGTGEGTPALTALPKGKPQADGHGRGRGVLSPGRPSCIHL